MQYSIRGIAPEIDAALRNRARAEGKSLNAVALEVLAEGVGLDGEAVVRRDLSDVAGSWCRDAPHREGPRRPGRDRRGALEVRLALDTNGTSTSARAWKPPSTSPRRPTTVLLPFAVVAELRAGFAMGRRSAETSGRCVDFS